MRANCANSAWRRTARESGSNSCRASSNCLPPWKTAPRLKRTRSARPFTTVRMPTGLLFADDSGLEVDALGGAPGVYSARFSGPHATDDSNNRLLLEKLRGVANRNARFVCAIALVEGERVVGVYHGAVEGEHPRRASRYRRLRLRSAVLLPGLWLHLRRGHGGTEVVAESPGSGHARHAGGL